MGTQAGKGRALASVAGPLGSGESAGGGGMGSPASASGSYCLGAPRDTCRPGAQPAEAEPVVKPAEAGGHPEPGGGWRGPGWEMERILPGRR